MSGQEITLAVVIAAAVVILLLVWLFMRRRRTQALRDAFGEAASEASSCQSPAQPPACTRDGANLQNCCAMLSARRLSEDFRATYRMAL